MGHPSGTDSASDHDLLVRIDERTIKMRIDQKEMKGDVGKINGRLREVEQEQSALRDRVNLVTGAGGLVTGALATVLAWLKLDT